MNNIKKILTYFQLLILLILLLFLINAAILLIIAGFTNNNAAYISTEWLSNMLTHDENYTLSEEARKELDDFNRFAMLIDNNGNVIWEYQLPSDLPRTYSLKDIASFSRWYIKDYPVFCHIREDGILVIGNPKHSTWKYQIIFQIDTMNAFIQFLIPLFLLDILVLILVPMYHFRKQEKAKERAQSEWIAGVSHDIRTPLSLIVGYSNELSHADCPTAFSDKAKIIEEQALKIRTLIQNLNTENKLEHGYGRLNKTAFVLSALLRDTVCDIINREPDLPFTFEIDIDKEMETATIHGDSELFERMLYNLIGNSLYHNKDGCQIIIQLTARGSFYLLTISDNGSGISKEKLQSLNSLRYSHELPEHGLGLLLVKQIVRTHHWKIHFEQNEPSGLKCTVRIRKHPIPFFFSRYQ